MDPIGASVLASPNRSLTVDNDKAVRDIGDESRTLRRPHRLDFGGIPGIHEGACCVDCDRDAYNQRNRNLPIDFDYYIITAPDSDLLH